MKAVQLSDVIAGFLGKYFTFLKDSSVNIIKSSKKNLSTTQLETLQSLKALIDISDDHSRGFFNTVSSEDEKRKHNWFLHEKGFI